MSDGSNVHRLVCRRCGKPLDDDHPPAPYLCPFEPDREKVSAALRRALMKVVEE